MSIVASRGVTTTEVSLPPLILSAEAYEEWLKSFWPLMGAEEGDDDDDSDDDSSDNDDDDSDDDSDDDDSSDDDDDSDDDDESTKALKAEKDKNAKLADRLRRAEHAAKEAKREAREARTKAASESGDWERLANERQAEVDDLNEKLAAAEERATTAETNLDGFQREVRVNNIASRLGFRDPGDAIKLLDKEATGDDKSAERALRTLAKDKEYLVDQRRVTGRGGVGGGNGDGGLLTKEQLDRMSPAELQANEDLVNRSLAALQPGGG